MMLTFNLIHHQDLELRQSFQPWIEIAANTISPSMLGPRLWNYLPKNISQIADLDMFKQELTKFLLRFADNPPADGYVAPNDNSLTKWCENRAEAHLLGRLQNAEYDDPAVSLQNKRK